MKAEEIFFQAVEIADSHQRREYLEQAYSQFPDHRQEVEELLLALTRAGSFLGTPIVAPSSNFELEPLVEPYQPGCQVGPFQLQEVIGRGGMGVVYRAQQTEPVKRMVALKIIQPGIASSSIIARFETERQALAIMDHPNIARVIDAGTTATGQPYFVMELIEGVPITKYCDRKRLTPRQRLELMIPVCEAIQHAHQKGVIHRDIKPSNVLVAEYDSRPVPKIIDFGVAKAIGNRLSDHSYHTDFGVVVGTLEYMSPEQAGLNQLDIDTRTDVYSLGVLMYELLTGSTPIDCHQLTHAAMTEMIRFICDVEPQRPSTRISKSGEAPSVAANRNTEPARLSSLVRGDLDWITMKALDKDRQRRYQTASALANDIQHYLHDEPVDAGPPTLRYRFVKFVRRNRVVSIFGSLLALALIAGVIGTSIGLVRSHRSLEREIAERKQAEQVSSLLESLFADLDTYSSQTDLKSALRNRLEALVKQISADTTLRPLSAARLQDVIGHTLLGIDEPIKAETALRAALAIREQELGSNHVDTLYSLNSVGFALFKQQKYADALPVFQAAGQARRQVLGDWKSAVPLYEKLVTGRISRQGSSHTDTINSKFQLATAYIHLKLPDQAIPLCRELCDVLRGKQPEKEVQFIRMLAYLGSMLLEKHEIREATAALEEARLIYDQKYPNKVVTFQIQSLLGAALVEDHQFDQAEPLLLTSYERMIQSKEALKPAEREKIVTDALNRIILLYDRWGKPDQANQRRDKRNAGVDKP